MPSQNQHITAMGEKHDFQYSEEESLAATLTSFSSSTSCYFGFYFVNVVECFCDPLYQFLC